MQILEKMKLTRIKSTSSLPQSPNFDATNSSPSTHNHHNDYITFILTIIFIITMTRKDPKFTLWPTPRARSAKHRQTRNTGCQ